MAEHAKFGPSSADRWMVCTASMGEIDRLRKSGEIAANESSIFADEGTVAHQIREESLLLGMDAHDFTGNKITIGANAFDVDVTMAEHLQPGIDWMREMLDEIDVEIRVKLDPWMPDQFGTMDAGGIFHNQSKGYNTLLSSDLKYGVGVPVQAVGSRQIRIYALGYWHHLGRPDVGTVLMNIDQPRCGGMKFWEIPLSELLDFGKEVSAAYLRIQTGDVEFAPSEKTCKWCPVKNTTRGCPAYDDMMYAVFADAFDDTAEVLGEPQFQNTSQLTSAKRYFIVKNAKLATKWLAKLHDDSLDAAISGTPDPGSKAVIGQKGNRVMSDKPLGEKLLYDAIGMDAYKPLSVIGVTEIEKQLKPGVRKKGHPDTWRRIGEILTQSDGKPILVDETDPREAITPLSDEFDDL